MSVLLRSVRLPAAYTGLVLAFVTTSAFAADKDGFEPIFDGTTLDGWDGNPEFWSVKDGAITGQTTAENPTKGNTFLIWRKGEVGNFELALDYKIVGGNSGIQYRSQEAPNEKWVIGGYQADIEAGDNYSGINYDERGRGILAQRGQQTVIRDDGKPEVVGQLRDTQELQSHIKKDDWNEYRIIADGYTFIHTINGQVTSIVTDADVSDREATGLLALQVHAGPPMTVQFRNIRLKRLDGERADAEAKSSSLEIRSNGTIILDGETISVEALPERIKRRDIERLVVSVDRKTSFNRVEPVLRRINVRYAMKTTAEATPASPSTD